MNVAGLYAEGRVEYELARQHLTAELGVPALAAVTRHTHANCPKSTDEGNFQALSPGHPASFHHQIAAGPEKISGQLFISRRTVETHRKSSMAKTHSKNMVDLNYYAVRQGLV